MSRGRVSILLRSGLSSLVFRYRVQASDLDLDGIESYLNGPTLNGRTITVRGGTKTANLADTAFGHLIIGRYLVDGRNGDRTGGGSTNPGEGRRRQSRDEAAGECGSVDGDAGEREHLSPG